MIKSVLLVLKPFNLAGSERSAMNLVKPLSEMGIHVYLVAERGSFAPFIPKNIKAFLVPVEKNKSNNVLFEKKVLEVVEKYNPDLIHAHGRNALSCCQLARDKTGIPVISHEHMGYKKEEYDFVALQLGNYADRTITVGPKSTRKLIEHGLGINKVISILNAVDVKDFPKLKRSHKVILCLSRIVEGKHIDKLIKAFKLVLAEVDDARLVIAGDDDWDNTKPKIEEMLKQEGLCEKVLLFPAQYDIYKFHCAADVFCYPPISKGMSVMEAMASGIPVVATESKVKPFLVEHNISGLLVSSPDPFKLAENLIFLLNNQEIARKMGLAAREKIHKQFNIDRRIPKLLEVYEQVTADKQSKYSKIIPYLAASNLPV